MKTLKSSIKLEIKLYGPKTEKDKLYKVNFTLKFYNYHLQYTLPMDSIKDSDFRTLKNFSVITESVTNATEVIKVSFGSSITCSSISSEIS